MSYARELSLLPRKEVSISSKGAAVNGYADDSDAWLRARDDVLSGGIITMPAGYSRITRQIDFPAGAIRIAGHGLDSSFVSFEPSSDNLKCFSFAKPGAEMFYNGLSDMTIVSPDTTYTKTAIDLNDVGNFVLGRVAVKSFYGGDSTALYIKGRDAGSVHDVYLQSCVPMRLGGNPNSSTIDVDGWNFHNVTYASTGDNTHAPATLPHYCIVVDDKTILTQLSFTGYQAFVGCIGVLRWVNSGTADAVSYAILFENFRKEQGYGALQHAFHIDFPSTSSNLHTLELNSGTMAAGTLLYGRNINLIEVDGVITNDSHDLAIFDLDGCTTLDYKNVEVSSLASNTIANMPMVTVRQQQAGYLMPRSAVYSKAASAIYGSSTVAITGATPSVLGVENVSMTQSGATNVTALSGAVEGQIVRILFADGNSTIKASIGKLSGGADFVGTADDMLTLQYRGTTWRELSRSVNA